MPADGPGSVSVKDRYFIDLVRQRIAENCIDF